MSAVLTAPTSPFLHEGSQQVRFSVRMEEESVPAGISVMTLHHHFRPQARNEDPLETFRAHAVEIEAAVRRRVQDGSYKPVLLREFDLRQQRTAKAPA